MAGGDDSETAASGDDAALPESPAPKGRGASSPEEVND